MFQDACRFYWSHICKVVGYTALREKKASGMGCFLTLDKVITAKHTVDQVLADGHQPALLFVNGIYALDVIWENDHADLSILKMGEPSNCIRNPCRVQIGSRWLAQSSLTDGK